MPKSMYEFVVAELQAIKGSWPQVARDTGIPLRTLEKIARREVRNPGVHGIEQLERYFVKSNPPCRDHGRAICRRRPSA